MTGACFADLGHEVVCVDNDQEKIRGLRRGRMPIFEPGLEQLTAMNVAAGRLAFSVDLRSAVSDADAVFIAVGTPSRPIDGHADRSFVFAVAREIAGSLRDDAVVAVKSTVPVGTGEEVASTLMALRGGRRVSVVSNPEFLRAGSAIRDFMEPDRIVIGADDLHGREVMQLVYEPMRSNPCPSYSRLAAPRN